MGFLSEEEWGFPQATAEAVVPPLDWASLARVLLDEEGDLQGVPVHGLSIGDEYLNDGDLVVVKPMTTAQNGQMVAARIKPEHSMSLEYYHRENGHLRLEPPNPALSPLTLKASEVEIQGPVVMIVRHVAYGEGRAAASASSRRSSR